MIKYLYLVLFLSTISFAQHDSSLINFVLDESISADELEEINYYYQNKINIHEASYFKLLSLPFTSKEIVDDIMNLRESNELNSLEDIQKIKHLSNYDLYILQNFLDFNKTDSRGSIKIDYDNYKNTNKLKNYIRYNYNNNLDVEFFNSKSNNSDDYNGTIIYQDKLFIGDYVIPDTKIPKGNSLKTNYDLQVKPISSNRKDYYRGLAYNNVYGDFGAKAFVSNVSNYQGGAELSYQHFSFLMQNLQLKNEYYLAVNVPYENLSTGLKIGLTNQKHLYKFISLSGYFDPISANITLIDYEVLYYSKLLFNYSDLQISYNKIKSETNKEDIIKIKSIFSLNSFIKLFPSVSYKVGISNTKKILTNIDVKYYDGEVSLSTKVGLIKNRSIFSYNFLQSAGILVFDNLIFEVGAYYNESQQEEKYFSHSINEIIMYDQIETSVKYFSNISYNTKNVKIDLSISKNNNNQKISFNTLFYF